MSSRGQMANNHAGKWVEHGRQVGGEWAVAASIRSQPRNRYTNKAAPSGNNNYNHNQKANELPGNPLIWWPIKITLCHNHRAPTHQKKQSFSVPITAFLCVLYSFL